MVSTESKIMRPDTVRTPEEVLRQARIAHSSRVAALTLVQCAVDRETQQRRTSLIRMQYDKDRSPFSLLDATALASGFVEGDDGHVNLNLDRALHEALNGEEGLTSVAGFDVSYLGAAVPPSPRAALAGMAPGFTGSSFLCYPAGATSRNSVNSGSSANSSNATAIGGVGGGGGSGNVFGSRICRDHAEWVAGATAASATDPDPDGQSADDEESMAPARRTAAQMPSPSAASAAPFPVAAAAPLGGPTIAWGESPRSSHSISGSGIAFGTPGGGMTIMAGRRTPDPVSPAPLEPDPSTQLGRAMAHAAPGSALASLLLTHRPPPAAGLASHGNPNDCAEGGRTGGDGDGADDSGGQFPAPSAAAEELLQVQASGALEPAGVAAASAVAAGAAWTSSGRITEAGSRVSESSTSQKMASLGPVTLADEAGGDDEPSPFSAPLPTPLHLTNGACGGSCGEGDLVRVGSLGRRRYASES
ncbi:hypothetical protein GPECTOR_17g846 [Gonium pectorale]|uniref:Uncharacterized protein n=1 Tax=Gonium pectorale TaxID=33097 RepID=A0A150GK38_GONPE|nr:hypothetical protein GPECTOR_17g846 [Gonium pectorale]|eukprot:KXZ50209.1 hypothetical protein GPECTOR_17g846 [Gonium pectorale]